MEYFSFLPLFGPGLALVFWFIPNHKLNWFARIIIGLGFSLAFYPVLLLLFYVMGIPVNTSVIYAIIIVSFILLGLRLYPSLKELSFPKILSPQEIRSNDVTTWLFLLVILILSAHVRIAVVKDLKVPMWADSYHHTMISQLMIDNNGLFSSWLPYAPLRTFTYHFGFHGVVASYHWLTGSTLTRAVIVTGQVINFLTVLTSYLLTHQLTGKLWAGNFAALFIGLISPMPFFYFNWGRYPQLTGLALLPIAIILTMNLFNQKRVDRKWSIITGLAIAGLGLSHYGVLVFFILFGGLFVLYKFIETRPDWLLWRELTLKLLLVGVITGILTAPWMWNFLTGRFLFIVTTTIERGANNPTIQAHNALGPISFFLNTHWYVLTILGAGWAIWRRDKWVVLVFIWGSSLMLLAHPHYLGLPGTGLINNLAIFISLFLPISVILGNLAADAMAKVQPWHPWSVGFAALLLLALGVHGVRFRLASFQPHLQLVTDQDLYAMEWIRENIPEDAKFLVNDFLAYGNSTVVGSDAGWWIPFFTNRQTNLPPLIYPKEMAYESGFFDKIRTFQQQTKMNTLLTDKGWQILQGAHITHIYIGQQDDGPVWYTEEEHLDTQKLEASPFYQLVYQADNVAILAVKTDIP